MLYIYVYIEGLVDCQFGMVALYQFDMLGCLQNIGQAQAKFTLPGHSQVVTALSFGRKAEVGTSPYTEISWLKSHVPDRNKWNWPY